MNRRRYDRHHTSHVAQLILTELERHRLTRSDLAHRMGRRLQYITAILTGRKHVNPYLAAQLERLLSRPALDFLAASLVDERCNSLLLAWLQVVDGTNGL